MQTLDDDYIDELLMTTTHHYLMFFTNKGRVYRLKAYEIPRREGLPGAGHCKSSPADADEHITALIPLRGFEEGRYLFMATRNGIVKKDAVMDYANVRKSGLAAISLREDDELIEVKAQIIQKISFW